MFSVPILRMLNNLMRPFLLLIEQLFPVITAENEISTDEAEIRQMAKIGSQKGFIAVSYTQLTLPTNREV